MAEPVKKRRKLLRWLLWVVATLILLCAIGVVWIQVYKSSLRAQIRAELAEVRKAGYPTNLEELNAWYNAPALQANAAPVYLDAFSHYNWPPSGDKQWSKLPLSSGAPWLHSTKPMAEDVKEAVQTLIGKNKQALALLHKAAGMAECRFPTDFTMAPRTGDGVLEQMSGMRDGARLLRMEACLRVENDDKAGAVESVLAGLALSQSMKETPFVITHLTRISCESYAVDGLVRVLNRTELSTEQLRRLDERLAAAELTRDLARTFRGEFCYVERTFAKKMEALPYTSFEEQEKPWQVRVQRYLGMIDSDELFSMRSIQRLASVAQLGLPERLVVARNLSDEIDGEIGQKWVLLGRKHILSAWLGAPQYRYLREDAKIVALLRTARVALAIERYRLKMGKLPEQLADLVPVCIQTIPSDPFDGKLMRYKKLTKGYVVYSVGENLKDDGGSEMGESWFMDLTFTVER